MASSLKDDHSNQEGTHKVGEDGASGSEDNAIPATNIRKVKNPTDLQRLKLEKLIRKHQENKEVFIPNPPKERKLRDPLEFIRNIWGSSAGVGSGDFDVYRGIRRREYARQKFILQKSEKEDLDEAYKLKVQQNIIEADERTAKKREKRQRKKQNQRNNKKKKTDETPKEEEDSDTSDEDAGNDTEHITELTQDERHEHIENVPCSTETIYQDKDKTDRKEKANNETDIKKSTKQSLDIACESSEIVSIESDSNVAMNNTIYTTDQKDISPHSIT